MPRPLAALAIVLAVLASYASSFDGAFVFDDMPAIADNPHVRSLLPLGQSFSAPPEVTTAGRPVAAFSFAVSYALAGGYDTWMFHATNVAIHACAALVLFGILRRTLLTPALVGRYGAASATLACLVALLWAVHPLQTQAVTYLVQRVESLMGLFLLLTLYCAIRAGEIFRLKAEATGAAAASRGGAGAAAPSRAGGRRLRGSSRLGGSSRLRGSSGFRGFRLQAEGTWAVLAVACCALGMATKQTMVGAPLLVMLWDWLFAGERDARLLLARRWKLYAGLAATWLLLAYLVVSEPRPHSVGAIEGWTPLRYLVTQAGVILHYLRLAVWPHPLVFDYDWPPAHGAAAVITVAIVAVLVAAAIAGVVRRVPAAFAAAWFFIILAPTSSLLPIATEVAAEHRMYLPLAAVIGLIVLAAHLRAPRVVPVAVVLVAAVFGVQTSARNRDYASDERIWVDTIDKQPSNARARNNYAVDLLQKGNFADAETQARTAIELKPSSAEAHKTLGVTLLSTGRPQEGIAELQRAIQLDPSDGTAYRNLGEAFGATGDLASAAKAFTEAARLTDDPFVLNRAGWLLATAPDAAIRNGAEALRLGRRAVDLTGRRDASSLDTLAAAYAELGQFDAAVAAGSDALAVARSTGQAAMVPELEQRLALYRSRRPVR